MSRFHTVEQMAVDLEVEDATLQGDLALPDGALGVVVFAHGSGSSRLSRRNRFVADRLNDDGLATLLLDLLTPEEDEVDQQTRMLRFDIPLLGRRLTGAVDWVRKQESLTRSGVGLFGASTGAAAALITAANRPHQVRAVVSRGGRPDLAGHALRRVRCPVLLIVGSNDVPVIAMNRDAAHHITAEHRVEIIPGATHLFEEPGALEQVSVMAGSFFREKLSPKV